MTDDVTEDDISQMREEGDLSVFVRSLIRRRGQQAEIPAAAPPKQRADGRPVGAWPVGTFPPGSPIPGRPAELESVQE